MIKNQHYVPQFYLKNFTNNNLLYVFDKQSKKIFPSNPKNVASEGYFYDFPVKFNIESPAEQSIENTFSSLETKFSTVLNEVLACINGKKNIVWEQRLNLSAFLAIQFLRTKYFRDSTFESMEEFSRNVLEFVVDQYSIAHNLDISKADYESKFDPELKSVFHAQCLFDDEYFSHSVQVFYSHIWIIGVNNTQQSFYTSDNPIVRHAHKRTLGIASEGIEIAFPLTPRLILILRERTFFEQYEKLDGKAIPLSTENVTYYNSLQVIDSYRQLYCSSNDFDLAKEMCREMIIVK